MVQKDSLRKKVIVICGPTASGKSSLAIQLAKKLNTEIISADSMNVYQGLDIGTAKPSLKERENVKHHLIDVVSPFDTFSVGDYKERAKPILESLLSMEKTPIICGGTGFYINSLLFNLSYGNSRGNLEVREKYNKMASEFGNQAVYNCLLLADKESAEKLHANDLKRVIRALEICESGQKKSDIKDDLTPIYEYDAYYIDFPREQLYSRINLRVDSMVQNGLLDEVKGLLARGINDSYQSMQGIGYKEILEYFSGALTLEQAVEKIKLNTRHYAKRQLTFFKRLNGLKPLSCENLDKNIELILENL